MSMHIKQNGNYVNVTSCYKKENNVWGTISESDAIAFIRQRECHYSSTDISVNVFEIAAPSTLVSETCQCAAFLNGNGVSSGVQWSITSGSMYASINSSSGLVTGNSNANASSITIQAVYGDFTATHEIVVTYKAGSSSSSSSQTVVDQTTGNSTTTTTTVTQNQDGTSSSSSTSITYNIEGEPLEKTNTDVDVSGNVDTQEIEYDENGQEVVTSYTIDTSGNSSGNGKQITTEEVKTEYYAFDTTKAFELMIHFKFSFSGQVNQATILNAKRADPEPWYGFDMRRNGTTNAIQYGAQFNSSTNNRGNITKPSNDIYKIKITYNPTVTSGNTFTIYNMLTNTNLFTSTERFPDLDELKYLKITIGCALDKDGNPQRRAKVDVYEFYVRKINT